jgi:hypothetical protein
MTILQLPPTFRRYTPDTAYSAMEITTKERFNKLLIKSPPYIHLYGIVDLFRKLNTYETKKAKI